MIKRIIACLTICLIITGLISPVFSDASALPQPNWSDPGISEIINISDLTGWMLNGGTFDVSTYTDAESFMNDYFNARTKTRLVSPGEAQEDYYEVLPGFGINNQLVAGESFARPLETNRVIASSFRDHTGYGRRLSNEVNNALLSSGSLYDTKIPLLNEIEFANFVGFNHDALRLYSEFFNNEEPTPQPDIPEDIQTLINIINERTNDSPRGFWFFDNLNPNGGLKISGFEIYNYSWFTTNNAFSLTDYTITSLCLLNGIQSIYINSVGDGTYSCSYSSNNYTYNYLVNNNTRSFNYGQIVNNGDLIASTKSSSIDFNSSGSLNQIFNALKNKFKNINIYVDNEPWAIVGDVPSTPSITPEFPDAVGGEELETTTWPIARPRAPYYTNVPGVLQAIEDAIADDGKLDIDDLKPYLTDENGDPVPDPIFDPEPVPIPVPDPVNPDIVPGLPVLPAMPPEMPGFNGVSVLAEIINFTNQSLPTYLIVTFWGIIFGIVILGLIKILHK